MASFPLKDKKIWVAGHKGMVGSAILKKLGDTGATPLTVDKKEVDLRDQSAVAGWITRVRPDGVILAAAKVGGIGYNNSSPADFIYDNLAIETNVIHQSYVAGVQKLLFLGSSCIYPKLAKQPITEDSLLTGPLEPTNQWYAIAKIAGMKMVEAYRKQYGVDYISVMPTNLYGPGDTYDVEKSHVIPALIKKIHQAKVSSAPYVELWGSGTPRREFLYVDDLADACILLFQNYSGDVALNIGTGEDVSIADLAVLIKNLIGYKGELKYNADMPDGTPRKLLDVSRVKALGWCAKTSLEEGLSKTYQDYINRCAV